MDIPSQLVHQRFGLSLGALTFWTADPYSRLCFLDRQDVLTLLPKKPRSCLEDLLT